MLTACQTIHVEKLEILVCEGGGNVTIMFDVSKHIITDHPAISIPLIPGI
jgi:hypothetical protein